MFDEKMKSCTRLDLKYRPKRFADVVGNQGVVKLLLARSNNGSLGEQSMMFGGPKGSGKTTLARLVARALVCSDKMNGEPCGVCDFCMAVLAETSSCVEELDAASQGTVDRIREMVHAAEYDAGGVGNIYIIDEAQRLSAAAQDAMLRAVEDRTITVILCTTEPHKIRGPIRSRVEEYPISTPSHDDMTNRIAFICNSEGIAFEQDALAMIVRMSDCPRSCIKTLGSVASVQEKVTVKTVAEFLRFGSYELVDKILDTIDADPRLSLSKLDELAMNESPGWIRDAMVMAITSALRVDVGAKPVYPVPTRFFQTRLCRWSEFAKQISTLDKPTVSDVVVALLGTRHSSVAIVSAPHPTVSTSHSVSTPHPTTTVPSSQPASPSLPKHSVDIDVEGIKFSHDEKLTTLDQKIGLASPKTILIEDESTDVEYRGDLVPMSSREFVRGLVNRLVLPSARK